MKRLLPIIFNNEIGQICDFISISGASGEAPGKLHGMGKLPKMPLLSQLKTRCLIE